jgi:hypothetical protein
MNKSNDKINNDDTTKVEPQIIKIERTENKSEMIRRMFFKEGIAIKDIAKTTNIRYQMVRNIVIAEQEKINKTQSK